MLGIGPGTRVFLKTGVTDGRLYAKSRVMLIFHFEGQH